MHGKRKSFWTVTGVVNKRAPMHATGPMMHEARHKTGNGYRVSGIIWDTVIQFEQLLRDGQHVFAQRIINIQVYMYNFPYRESRRRARGKTCNNINMINLPRTQPTHDLLFVKQLAESHFLVTAPAPSHTRDPRTIIHSGEAPPGDTRALAGGGEEAGGGEGGGGGREEEGRFL